jgi:hypothetical protein
MELSFEDIRNVYEKIMGVKNDILGLFKVV